MKYILALTLLLTSCARKEPCTTVPPCAVEPVKQQVHETEDSGIDETDVLMFMLLMSTMDDD